MIAIVDYGVGNLGSIANMFKKVGVDAIVTKDLGAIREAKGLLLPGVGHFDHCARALRQSNLLPLVQARVTEEKVPVLGICVGMQLLARTSEEGTEPGLGWIAGDVKKFQLRTEDRLPVPHMGWARVTARDTSRLFDVREAERFYFVHSFHMVCDDPADAAADAEYGYRFVAAVQRGNVYGTQFHPEKSHRFGKALMRRFAEVAGAVAAA